MSAELLREAAATMRAANMSEHDGHSDKFMLAIADWLEEVAERQEPLHRWGRSHGWTGARFANAVARAYLGRES